MSFAVERRRPELGVRIALGAASGQILRLVLAGGIRLILLGLAIGLLVSLAVTRAFASQLYQLSPSDPLTFACGAGILAMVALAACFPPALRAMRVEPVSMLRNE